MIQVTAICLLLTTVQAAEFQVTNRMNDDIWVGIQGKDGQPYLENGGFVLGHGKTKTIQSPPNWSGRFWARTGCDRNSKHCATGDCGNRLQCSGSGPDPPVTLGEISLRGHGGLDYYDISLIDGFNVPLSIEPVEGREDGSRHSCKKSACAHHINTDCPEELQLESYDGVIVGCKSACLAFNTEQYCCRGAYDNPNSCISADWSTNYPKFFKDRCPNAYSYAYDDHRTTFTCRAETYKITFGI